jgi:hypothetical protein
MAEPSDCNEPRDDDSIPIPNQRRGFVDPQATSMIRSATSLDIDFIARNSWELAHRLNVRQMGCMFRGYPTIELLSDLISQELATRSDSIHWLVFDSSTSPQTGFFRLSRIAGDKLYKRWGFPDSFFTIDWFPWLLEGQILVGQLGELVAFFPGSSIFVRVATQLRDTYWAVLKVGFRVLGECPLPVGAEACLFLDRQTHYEDIKSRLRKLRLVVA